MVSSSFNRSGFGLVATAKKNNLDCLQNAWYLEEIPPLAFLSLQVTHQNLVATCFWGGVDRLNKYNYLLLINPHHNIAYKIP